MATAVRMLVIVALGAMVLLGSFWATLKLLRPADPDADLITITQATYGLNCRGFVMPGRLPAFVKPGNVTDAISASCSGQHELCTYLIDATRIGDPAPGCSKSMTIEWRCGKTTEPHVYQVAPEAHTQTAYIGCP